MSATGPLILGAVLLAVGVFGAVVRRTLVAALAGLQVAVAGVAVALAGVAQFSQGTPAHRPVEHGESAAVLAVVGVVAGAALLGAGAGTALLLRRRQGDSALDAHEPAP